VVADAHRLHERQFLRRQRRARVHLGVGHAESRRQRAVALDTEGLVELTAVGAPGPAGRADAALSRRNNGNRLPDGQQSGHLRPDGGHGATHLMPKHAWIRDHWRLAPVSLQIAPAQPDVVDVDQDILRAGARLRHLHDAHLHGLQNRNRPHQSTSSMHYLSGTCRDVRNPWAPRRAHSSRADPPAIPRRRPVLPARGFAPATPGRGASRPRPHCGPRVLLCSCQPGW